MRRRSNMNRILSTIVALAIILTCTACSTKSSDSTGDSSETKTDSTCEDVSSQEDTKLETTTEEKTSETKKEENTIEFTDGSKFICTEYEVEIYNYDESTNAAQYTINIPNNDCTYTLIAKFDEGVTYTDVADADASKIKEESGMAPMLDIHGEGVYITGLYRDLLFMQFTANEKENDKTYSLVLHTDDSDTCIDIFNSIIDDLLASGVTDNEYRTQYGEKVEGDSSLDLETELGTDDALDDESSSIELSEGNFPKVNIPDDYKCTYSSQYTLSYEKPDNYTVLFKSEPIEELLEFIDGGSDQYLGLHTLSEYGTYQSSDYGTLYIIEARNNMYNDMYEYQIVNKERTVCMELNHWLGDKLSETECKSVLQELFK